MTRNKETGGIIEVELKGETMNGVVAVICGMNAKL